jgi:hypothetical protein
MAIGASIQSSDPTKTHFSVNIVALNPNGSLSVIETFNNVSVSASDPTYIVTVINADSQFVSVAPVGTPTLWLNSPFPSSSPASPPFATPPFLTGGFDGVVLDPTLDGSGGYFTNELNADGTGTGGVRLLDRVDIFNLLCVPGETEATNIQNLQKYCHDRRAFYIVDAPPLATPSGLISSGPVGNTAGSITGQNSINSAYYFPWVQAPDPLTGNRPRLFPPVWLYGRNLRHHRCVEGSLEGPCRDRCQPDWCVRPAVRPHRPGEREPQRAGSQLPARV